MRHWRFAVPALLALLVIDAVAGVAAYSSGTWNMGHTEVLERWAAVREVCLVMLPTFVGVLVVGAGLLVLALRWAAAARR